MKLHDLKNKKWNYPALAFAFTFVGFLMVMLIKGLCPFGDSAMLYSDAYHQYYPFFLAFRRAILSGESLLYSWDVGLGMDYLGLIAYYLASPLNLLSLILPENWMLPYFSLMVPLKLGLAAMFFALFLQKLYGHEEIGLSLFGCFYGLCAWALAYLWNIMWLDTFALLPLVMLGMVRLLTQRKFMLYTLTLFLSILANYYIGFFTCVFLLLTFFCYEFCRWGGFKKFCIDLGLMALFSAIAIAMTAFLELPALAALQTTQSSVNTFPEGFDLNIADEDTWMGLLDAMRQVAGNMNGGLEPTFKEGLPNLYCGVFANALAFAFLFCRKVPLKDKISAVLLLLFFNISFIFRQLDYIWHGFHFTNMIPYRFSFLHSFVVLYMAYRAYLHREEFALWQVITAGVLAVGVMMCADNRFEPLYLAYNGAFLLLYLFILIYPLTFRKSPDEDNEAQVRVYQRKVAAQQKQCKSFLCMVIALELVLSLVNFGVCFPGTTTAFYPRGKEYSASMIRYMHEREWDELFFRAETTHSQTLNDGALNNYHGVSAFTSSANVKVTEFMRKLGYGAKNTYNRYCFEESSPVSNLFLGLKYMIERKGLVEENPYFTDLHYYGEVHLLENNAYLPLGFLAEPELAELSFEGRENAFDFQNDLFTAATGIDDPVWRHMYGSVLSITATDATLSNITTDGYCTYTTEDSGGQVNYRYTADREGFLCIRLDLSKRNDFTVYLNDMELYSESISLPQMLAVSQVGIGDVVDIRLDCGANENGTVNISAALMNDELFREGYSRLSQSVLELDYFSTTEVDGTILCNRDGLLYTSIPQNGNWHVYVDGEIAETELVGDAMLAIPLTKGYHEILLRYRNPAFTLGLMVSVGSSAALIGLYLLFRPLKKKGKYAK